MLIINSSCCRLVDCGFVESMLFGLAQDADVIRCKKKRRKKPPIDDVLNKSAFKCFLSVFTEQKNCASPLSSS